MQTRLDQGGGVTERLGAAARSWFQAMVKWLPMASAAFATWLGVAVMFGWHVRQPGLIQISVDFAPMQYNTALGFLFCGLGLAASGFKKLRIVLVCGAVPVFLGAATLAEYILGTNLGIDQAFMDHYITVETTYAGRMAPNTALSFLLFGLVLVSEKWLVRKTQRSWSAGLFGSIITGLGLIAIVGYLTDMSPAYAWGISTRMAVHTAAGFSLLGLGLIACAQQLEEQRGEVGPGDDLRIPSHGWWPFSAGIAVMTFAVSLYLALSSQELTAVESLGLGAKSIGDEAVLIFGIIMAILVGLTLSLSRGASFRAKIAEESHRILRKEISQRHFAEEGQRESEQRLQLILDSVPVGIAYLDRQERFLFANRNYGTLLGVAPPDLIGRKMQEVIGEEAYAVASPFAKIALAGEMASLENRIGPDGKEKSWVSAVYAPHFGADGAVEGFFALVQDITERRRAERLLDGRSQVLWRIAKGNPLEDTLNELCLGTEEIEPGLRCSVLIFNKEKNCLDHGAAPSLPDSYNDAIDGLVAGPAVGSCGTAAFKGEPVIVEDVFSHPSWKDFRDLAKKAGFRACWSQPFFSEDGEVLGTFAMYFTETRAPTGSELDLIADQANLASVAVTKAKAEDKLRESERELKETQRLSHVGSWEWNLADGTVTWTAESYRIWGVEPEDFEPTFENITAAIPPDEAKLITKVTQHAVETGESYEVEHRVIRPDGSIRHVLERGEVSDWDENGKPVRVRGSMLDVTEQRNAEEQLRQSQKLDVIGQLTGGVAHDFNNLLAIIKGNLALLVSDWKREGGGGATDPMELIQPVLDASDRGAELVRRLLAFSRKQPLKPDRLSLRKVMEGMEGMLKRTIGENISLKSSFDVGDWLIQADASQLESSLLNLFLNARDAMPSGGELTLQVSHESLTKINDQSPQEIPPGDYVILTVSDTGSGMSPKILEKAFDPFFTTKRAGVGSGLGLSMVHGFVKQSGGHITLSSKIGKGTTVKLSFPRTHGEETLPEERVATEPTGGGETILVVEDEKEVRRMTVRVLKRLGYSVLAAENGVEALSIYEKSSRVDLLLTDVVLTGDMSGPEIAEALHQKEPDLKVLFMSGYTEDAISHYGRINREINLISKPFSPKGMADHIREVLSAD